MKLTELHLESCIFCGKQMRLEDPSFEGDILSPWRCPDEGEHSHATGFIWAYVVNSNLEDLRALNIRIDDKQYHVNFSKNITEIYSVMKGGIDISILSMSGCYVPQMNVDFIRDRIKTLVLFS